MDLILNPLAVVLAVVLVAVALAAGNHGWIAQNFYRPHGTWAVTYSCLPPITAYGIVNMAAATLLSSLDG